MRNNPLPLSAVHPRGSRAVWKGFPFNGNHGGERPGKQGRSKGRSNGEGRESAQQARRGKPRSDTSIPAGDFLQDRKSVGSGKSVSVRVDLGVRRIIKNKKKEKK